MFIPRLSDCNDHHLYYCPFNVYAFFVYFYSVYERILKAKELIKEKIQKDFEEDFSKADFRFKFNQKYTNKLVDERFNMFICSIVTTMNSTNVLDTNKYEDLARELLGNEAYLLFQIDKLINNCIK